MTENNFARLQQWKKLIYKFDYITFCEHCEEAELPQMNIVEFAQKSGMLIVAQETFPDMELEKAYLKFVSEMQPVEPYTFIHTPVNVQPSMPLKTCCGGGQVR